MSFSSDDPSRYEMLQDWLLQILALLPHMPITAVGINFGVHYRIFDRDRLDRIGHQLAPKDLIWNELFENPGMRSLTIQSLRKGDFPGEINITVEPSFQYAPGLFVRSNNHFQPAENTQTEVFSGFLRLHWLSASTESRRVAEKIFQTIP